MFLLDGKPLSPDQAFTHNGIQYPANWLRLSSVEEREAIGITEVPDPPYYDQRFYWGYTASGTLIPKDHGVLVSGWVDQTRYTANTILVPSDWTIIRETDNGTLVPSGLKSWRQEIRVYCETKVLEIQNTQTTDQLADYITYASPSGGSTTDYSYWPQWPPAQPAPSGEASANFDNLNFNGGATGSQTVF